MPTMDSSSAKTLAKRGTATAACFPGSRGWRKRQPGPRGFCHRASEAGAAQSRPSFWQAGWRSTRGQSATNCELAEQIVGAHVLGLG